MQAEDITELFIIKNLQVVWSPKLSIVIIVVGMLLDEKNRLSPPLCLTNARTWSESDSLEFIDVYAKPHIKKNVYLLLEMLIE
jgi:hypothetical protein